MKRNLMQFAQVPLFFDYKAFLFVKVVTLIGKIVGVDD